MMVAVGLGLVGVGSQMARIVKAEKFIDPKVVFYAFMSQPVVAAVFAYGFAPDHYKIPDMF